ncbi:aminoglycoside phosphotransferase family protein [Allobranchiibius huperziae]|uniref:Streptomycin 6-kinase n=1 Tax=Allobranchiibius huperziae TaxID=1874116 RepID=A0A853DH52_9MICO|nr:streptomycin 6-kinase [Allobranchiibius huperziae]
MSGLPVTIPPAFFAKVDGRPAEGGGPDGTTWLASLPRLVEESADLWQLELDDDPSATRHGECALVVPCRRDGEPAVLKVTWPHPEAKYEHLALRTWDGTGAVRLLAADPGRWAMVLERLHGDTSLETVPILDACEVIGGLFRRLDAPPMARVTNLPDECGRWRELCRAGSPQVPRRMTQQAASLLGDLAEGSRADLVHQDLHFANVLAGDREPWLAIDPKPINARWEFAVAPVIWNRWDEALRATSVRAHLRARLGVLCESAGLDEDLARHWSFVRLVLNALGEWLSGAPDQSALSCYLTAAKAMQE